MKYLFAAVYVLVLITQLPHVWWAYASLESPSIPLAHWTAIGAAVAFELSTGVFTYRIINGSRRRWTRVGLAFFIVASVVANGYYYGWARSVFDTIWPAFATLALPLSLALFAHEFGTEVKREERAAKRAERQAERHVYVDQQTDHVRCDVCNRVFVWPGDYADERTARRALAGHMNAHRNGDEREPIMEVME
jgi:hypothetical protein